MKIQGYTGIRMCQGILDRLNISPCSDWFGSAIISKQNWWVQILSHKYKPRSNHINRFFKD